MLRLRSQQACPRLIGATLLHCHPQLVSRRLASSDSTPPCTPPSTKPARSASTTRNRRLAKKKLSSNSSALIRPPLSAPINQPNDQFRQGLRQQDIKTVYDGAKVILAKTTLAAGQRASPAGEAKSPEAPRPRIRGELVRKLKDHVSVLEELIQLEEAGLRGVEQTSIQDESAGDGEVVTSSQPPDESAPPTSQGSVSKEDVENMKAEVEKLLTMRRQLRSMNKKMLRNASEIREDTFSVAKHVLKAQGVSLGKRESSKDLRYGSGFLDNLFVPGSALSPTSWDFRGKKGSTISKKHKPPQKTMHADVQTLKAESVKLVPIDVNETRVPPQLTYKLDRVLFAQGPYQLQDLRSKVYNFDPYLARIMPIEEFDFKALKGWTTSSKDNKLISIAAEHGKKYCGSTSSMTSVLSHFHYLLSNWRPLTFSRISRGFESDSHNFTAITRSPAATFLRWRDGVYAIDSDKEFDTATILSMLGRSLEKLLTLPRDDYEKYRRSRSMTLTEEEKNADEVYHYSGLSDFMMRSQLDAHDNRLPGSGVFDLKTRAVVTVRMDAERFERRRDYEIKRRHGDYESYEREYYDLIRSAFLKYSLQVRMGRMDGIFLAYHNTQRIFGFQYIPLSEMDLAIHGTDNILLGDSEFKLSLKLWNEILNKFMDKFHGRSVRLHVETKEGAQTYMYVFAKPVTEEEISAIQDTNAKVVEAYEDRILGIQRDEVIEEVLEREKSENADSEVVQSQAQENGAESAQNEPLQGDVWDEIMARVEESMENEELGSEHVREAIRVALEQSGLLADVKVDDIESYVNSLLEALIRDDGPKEEDAVEEAEKQAVEAGGPKEVRVEDSAEATQPVSSDAPSLQELIMRQIDAKAQKKSTTATDDDRLVDFGRILSQLVELRDEDKETNGQDKTTDAPAEAPEDADDKAHAKEAPCSDNSEVVGYTVTVRHKQMGSYKERVSVSQDQHKIDWDLEYSITEIEPDRVQALYESVLKRRRQMLADKDRKQNASRARMSLLFDRKMDSLSREGKKFREKEDQINSQKPLYVVGEAAPRKWSSVFGKTW